MKIIWCKEIFHCDEISSLWWQFFTTMKVCNHGKIHQNYQSNDVIPTLLINLVREAFPPPQKKSKFCYCRNRRRALWRKHSILLEKWIKQYKLGRIRQFKFKISKPPLWKITKLRIDRPTYWQTCLCVQKNWNSKLLWLFVENT